MLNNRDRLLRLPRNSNTQLKITRDSNSSRTGTKSNQKIKNVLKSGASSPRAKIHLFASVERKAAGAKLPEIAIRIVSVPSAVTGSVAVNEVPAENEAENAAVNEMPAENAAVSDHSAAAENVLNGPAAAAGSAAVVEAADAEADKLR